MELKAEMQVANRFGFVTSLAFSPDGATIVSGSGSKTTGSKIHVWDADVGI